MEGVVGRGFIPIVLTSPNNNPAIPNAIAMQ
jgi:hypothetical protein